MFCFPASLYLFIPFPQLLLIIYTAVLQGFLFTHQNALGEWYSCRGVALVANSGISTLGFKWESC